MGREKLKKLKGKRVRLVRKNNWFYEGIIEDVIKNGIILNDRYKGLCFFSHDDVREITQVNPGDKNE